MRLLPALDTKVLRELTRMWAQMLAIALVMACGLGVFLAMRSTMRSLSTARDVYYAEERLAHVFAGLERAPERLARRLVDLPGVQSVETRIVADVTLDVPEMLEPARGRLVSIPAHGPPAHNALHLRSGRMPRGGASAEVLLGQAFAEAHGLGPGDTVVALIDGRYEQLSVVGTALSPEYAYALAPGQVFPDDRLFGVIWMRRPGLASALDLRGAFNDVTLLLEHGASPQEVIARCDRVLDPFGGVGAIARADQQSAFFIDNELRQLDTFSWMVPSMFLAVAAFLLNVVIGRIVAGQRSEVAAMKAFGYRDHEVGAHYAKLVGLVCSGGCLLGIALGAWLGASLVRIYGAYYRFPELPYALGASEVAIGVATCLAAAALGTWAEIRRTVALPPAEAMRPPAPPVYRRTLAERLGIARLLPASARIVLREVERQPRRALLSVLGVAMATGLTVANAFTMDSVRRMLDVQFGLVEREDVQLVLTRPRALGALSSIEDLPGVVHAEPFRSVPVRLRSGARTENTALTGLLADASLVVLLDRDLNPLALPAEGLMLSRKLAELLDVGVGDALDVEVLEGRRRRVEARVAAVADTYLGKSAYMRLGALRRLLGETESMNGARLLVDEDRLEQLYTRVKRTPTVAGLVTRTSVVRKVRELLDSNLGVFVGISVSFSLVMAFGVLYNAARITLADRARELASLRVLGFRRREVGAILVGEIALLVAVGVPAGLLLGRWMAGLLVASPGYDTEQFRLPLVISPATYATAVLCVLAAAALSAWSAWRRLERFDIVAVLKTRD